MGDRGPVPKRDDQRAGHRSAAEKQEVVKTAGTVHAPACDPDWHPRAQDLYQAIVDSGQTRQYEPSDWAFLTVLMDQLTAFYEMSRPSAEMFKHITAGLHSLGVTWTDRRRQRLEIERENARSGNEELEVDEATADRFAGLQVVTGG